MLRISTSVVLLLIAGLLFPALSSQVVAQNEKPNIILINLDDADVDLLSPQRLATNFPNLHQLASEGIRFTNFHITTPLCGPSRACLFRGQYAHRCGIKVNQSGLPGANGYYGGLAEYVNRGYPENDLAVWMKQAGYHTALIGKYVNNGQVDFVPPGWDEFYCSLGASYYGTAQFTNRSEPEGKLTFRGDHEYRTNVETVDCLQLLNKHVFSGSDKPFFFYLAPFAPHLQNPGSGPMFDRRYREWWPNARMPITPDFDEADVSDKPAHVQALVRLSQNRVEYLHRQFRYRMLTMISIDRMVKQIRERLEALGELDNTFIILTSDNGYQLGHHRSVGKLEPYDRCTKVPLIVWGPNVNPRLSANHLLAHIDLAPTLVDLAGGQVPGFVDGISFKSLIEDPDSSPEEEWQFGVLIENWETGVTFNKSIPAKYTAVRTFNEIYVEHSSGDLEYYDLSNDPYQLENRVADLTSEERNFFKQVMQQLKWNPTVAITNVDAKLNGLVTRKNFDIQGVAEHQFGIRRIRLAIRDLETGNFWNGSEWQDKYFANNIDPELPRGQITDWNFLFTAATVPNDYGRLVFSARPIDVEGNAGIPFVFRANVDRGQPETELLKPSAGQVVSTPAFISGFAYDQSPIREVRLIIKNRDTGLYFDGTDWVADRAIIYVTPRSRTFWNFQFDPPPGRYWFSARAYDVAGNYDSTPAFRTFEVQD